MGMAVKVMSGAIVVLLYVDVSFKGGTNLNSSTAEVRFASPAQCLDLTVKHLLIKKIKK